MAVPSVQHSPTFGQRASSHTVWRSSSRNVFLRLPYVSPPGARTLSHAGFGAKRDGGEGREGGEGRDGGGDGGVEDDELTPWT